MSSLHSPTNRPDVLLGLSAIISCLIIIVRNNLSFIDGRCTSLCQSLAAIINLIIEKNIYLSLLSMILETSKNIV